MSTKTTARERTWTPRYAWMPVSTRHIKNGAHRIAKRSPTTLLEGLGEQRHVELDGRDVVVGALDAADGRREDIGLRPRFLCDPLGELKSFQGSTRITLIPSAFIWRMIWTRCCGDGGMPGRSSSVPTWTRPNRVRK